MIGIHSVETMAGAAVSAVSGRLASPSDESSNRDPVTAVGMLRALTSFVGRDAQLEDICRLLRDPTVHLLTLTGPAGVGKTRLATAAVARVADAFPDGVTVASLAVVRDRNRVPYVIAEALGLQSVAGETFESRVINHLRDRHALLLLDNLEQLLPVPFLVRLLTSCRNLTVLVTSREVLRLSGEFEYVVPPLGIPDSADCSRLDDLQQVESVALLVDRARQVAPAFALTIANAADVAEICARLDGLPLAIELAAARLKVFSPAALLSRLSDQLALLTGGPFDRPEHQRTIRGTIGWSHTLLAPCEQALFDRLGVFAGEFTAGAVAAVCVGPGDPPLDEFGSLEVLISLADKSLIQRSAGERDDPRFYLLQTIMHFALDCLRSRGELEPVHLRYAMYYLALAESMAPALTGPDQTVIGARFEAEQTNLRAALGILRDAGEVESWARLACAMWRFWRLRGALIEGRYWFDGVLDAASRAELPAPLRARVCFMAGWLAMEQGDIPPAQRLGEESLAIADAQGDDTGIGLALRLLSFVDSRLDNNTAAIDRMERSLVHHRRAGDADDIAGTLNNLAILALDAGEYERVVGYCRESREAFLALGNLHGASHSIDTMGVALYCLGRFDEAMRASRESLAIDRQLADIRGLAVSLDHVGKCARALDELEVAWEAHEESLRYRRDVGDPRGLLVWLEAMALWMAQAGRGEEAALALGAIEIARTAGTMPILHHEAGDHAETTRRARDLLGEERFERTLAKGRWLTIDEMIERICEAVPGALAGSGAGTGAQPIDDLAARYGLTPREHEVLLLVGKRYRDREIAEALSISPRTVARHVTGILAKLGVSSRYDAAALVENRTRS